MRLEDLKDSCVPDDGRFPSNATDVQREKGHAFSLRERTTTFYASAIVLLAQRETWKRRLAPLAAVGRMALTNYLLQTLICTSIFLGYGLGFYGTVGPAAGLVLTIVIYAFQVVFSVWWIGRFHFGPAEWLWRTLTYGKLQPMRLRRA